MSHEPFPTEDPAVVTVGLLYANGPLHIGHLRGYISGDAYARALRTLGQKTAFVSGSDMHGTPVAVNAAEEGVSPEEYALDWHEQNKDVYPEFGIDFDRYGHTRTDTNVSLTEEFVRTADEGGHIHEQEIEVAWDAERDQPLPDRYVEGTCPYCGAHARGDECDEGCGRHLEPGEVVDPVSVLSGNPAEYRTREHEFLKLSDFQEYLSGFLDRLEGTDNAKNQPREWVEGTLEDWCITRDLDWGIDYPGSEEDLVLYVWVDAPIEYVSATIEYAESETVDFDWKEVWNGDGEIVHVIGQDIIQHHTVFWPALLRANDYSEPRAIMAHGFVTLDGKGLSTSRNRAIWAEEYLDTGFHPDLLRYYVVSGTGFERDMDFSWERFAERVNGELVGTLGNFCYRSLLFAHRNYDGTPAVKPSEEVTERISDAIEEFRTAVNDYRLRDASSVAVDLAGFGNEYIQRHEPWKLVDSEPERAAQVIRDCVQLTHAIAVLAEPVMPAKADELWSQLGGEGSIHEVELEEALSEPAATFGEPTELVEGIEDETVAELNAALDERIAEAAPESGAETESETETTSETESMTSETDETDEHTADLEALSEDRIGFEEFEDLDIRVGEIVSAKGIEGADDLAQLEVDLGVETRGIVAGIKQLHDLDELPGTRVVVLANIEKAELFGVESNGMVLAAGEAADLLTTHEDSVPGTRIR